MLSVWFIFASFTVALLLFNLFNFQREYVVELCRTAFRETFFVLNDTKRALPKCDLRKLVSSNQALSEINAISQVSIPTQLSIIHLILQY